MMDRALLEEQLSQLPLYFYEWIDMGDLEFSERIRWICEHECPMYGKSWACPPGVGEVCQCEQKVRGYRNCLMVGTITETDDIANMERTLATRPEHEALTEQVRELMKEQGVDPFILSTEACTLCRRCAIEEGLPCRFPEKMHPCVESHGINLIPTLENLGLDFIYGENIITWYSLIFF